jgi:phage recombination protein Bet
MTNETTALAERAQQNGGGLSLTTDKLELIRRTLAPDLTNDELALFGEVAKRFGLDPVKRQLYAIKRGGRVTFQTSIDGFRSIAQRSGMYRGQLGPYWCGPDGAWQEVWLDAKPPKAAKVAVLRADFAEPLWAVARWDSYAQTTGLWPKMPDLMLAKVAEALALRKAFPEDLSGLYAAEEMDQADAPKQPAAKAEAKPVRKAQGSDKRQEATTSPEATAAIQPAVAETPASPEAEPTFEIGQIQVLYDLAANLPRNAQTKPQVDHLVTQHGFEIILRRLVNAHKLSCGSACPHLVLNEEPNPV